MKPLIYIDKTSKYLRIESDPYNDITITDAHSFLKDLLKTMFDYHKLFPKEKVGDYVKEKQNG